MLIGLYLLVIGLIFLLAKWILIVIIAFFRKYKIQNIHSFKQYY